MVGVTQHFCKEGQEVTFPKGELILENSNSKFQKVNCKSEKVSCELLFVAGKPPLRSGLTSHKKVTQTYFSDLNLLLQLTIRIL